MFFISINKISSIYLIFSVIYIYIHYIIFNLIKQKDAVTKIDKWIIFFNVKYANK